MKKLLKYWLPPVVWAALFFPVGNVYLSKPWLSRIVYKVLVYFFPSTTIATSDAFYLVIRKSFHFIEYAVLAYLLYRAFHAGRALRWKASWALWAGLIAVGYGLLDESLQRIVPGRKGSFIDWGIDSAGALAMLAFIYLRSRKPSREGPGYWGKLTRAVYLKRPFDVAVSGLGLILSSPLWIVFSFLIWAGDRGPIFYLQERVGRGGRIFKAIKFRSMIKDAEKGRGAVQAVENDPRVTRVGRIMRATAMDELPQLVNIFKGDMSFVGPRALRPEEKETRGDGRSVRLEEIPGYQERLAVRPGLTGLAQVYLPTDAPRKAKFRYDRLYIKKQTFWLDMKIMVLSFWITFRGKWESREAKV
ncbi:MAG: VanZ family protein [Candidatus Aminicenantes bacterium]|nr:VanZ family protein [Candidatus Aminicenantes bacterium]